MSDFDLKTYLTDRQGRVEAALDALLAEPEPIFTTLRDSMRYSLLAGGKRVRPILCLAAAEACGGDEARAMPAACALELMHSYTLIHDDLPCMDDDDLRRGKPTNHTVYGEAQALLAGNGLFTLAFEIVAKQAIDGGISTEAAARVTHRMATAIGWRGVIGGQSIDIEATGQTIDRRRVETICTHKTAVLIAASVACGAIVAGAPDERVEALDRYGRSIGLAFQVADDVLNVEGDAAALGKGTGTDEAAGKTTFVDVLGLPGARDYAKYLLTDALAALADFDGKAEPLRALARYIVTRDR
ncbi:MAG: polyprenyl synthetase family protein [Deltaproteobacteria bacterium]|nr:polyprenyl synthetase family protein [Deltaproteobacteria bacterium]